MVRSPGKNDAAYGDPSIETRLRCAWQRKGRWSSMESTEAQPIVAGRGALAIVVVDVLPVLQ